MKYFKLGAGGGDLSFTITLEVVWRRQGTVAGVEMEHNLEAITRP